MIIGFFRRLLIRMVMALLIAVAVLIIARNFIVKTALVEAIRRYSGLDAHIGTVDIGLWSTSLKVQGLVLFNPPGFSEKIMLDVPELFVDFELPRYLEKKELYLQEFRLNLHEIVVARSRDGRLNWAVLQKVAPQAARASAPAAAQPAAPAAAENQLRVERIVVRIGSVVDVRESSADKPKRTVYAVNSEYRDRDVRDIRKMIERIAGDVEKKLFVSYVSAMTVEAVAAQTGMALEQATEAVAGTAEKMIKGTIGFGRKIVGVTGEILKQTTETVKDLLPSPDKKDSQPQ
ncbi:MAG: hypothetical protein NC924_01380 [Candidatus Omnitrophica bacterium]|nr:hypothetical protein [Candidatus Omnitrophota bacterium]